MDEEEVGVFSSFLWDSQRDTQVSAHEQYSLPRGLEGLPDILWKP